MSEFGQTVTNFAKLADGDHVFETYEHHAGIRSYFALRRSNTRRLPSVSAASGATPERNSSTILLV
jgi:hypothetical protein